MNANLLLEREIGQLPRHELYNLRSNYVVFYSLFFFAVKLILLLATTDNDQLIKKFTLANKLEIHKGCVSI